MLYISIKRLYYYIIIQDDAWTGSRWIFYHGNYINKLDINKF